MSDAAKKRRVLVVGMDGMRPDMFDPEVMPALAGLVAQGVRATEYHSVYPTHTRAINTTLATGCTPGKHGWVANVFRHDGVTEDGIVDTADFNHVNAQDNATALNAIQMPTLGDILARHGKRMGLATAQASGASLIWTRKQHYPIATLSSTYGRADIQRIWDRIGQPPEVDPASPSKIPHAHWVKRAVIDMYLDDADADVILFYMVEPDFSLHYYGLGAKEVTDALRECDRALGEVLEAMEKRGIRDQFDVIVLSDHGHSTTVANRSLTEHLDRARPVLGDTMPELVTASDYIYSAPGSIPPTPREIEPLVRWIQEQDWAGAIFGSGDFASLPGMLPLASLWNGVEGDRAPLLAVSPAWSDEPNEHGVPGLLSALTEQAALRSTHGSCSPWDMHAFWAANGPSFREGVSSDVPAGATDLLPTVLSLLGIQPPAWVDGRVMSETFDRAEQEPSVVEVEQVVPESPHLEGFEPAVELHRVGSTRYIHRARNGSPASTPTLMKGQTIDVTD